MYVGSDASTVPPVPNAGSNNNSTSNSQDNFCNFNDPFGVNLDYLSYAVARANEDIKLLSRRKAEINDLLYNLMFDGKRIKVVDTFEFRKGDITYLDNV